MSESKHCTSYLKLSPKISFLEATVIQIFSDLTVRSEHVKRHLSMDWGVVAGVHVSKIANGPETRADILMGGFDVPVDMTKEVLGYRVSEKLVRDVQTGIITIICLKKN